MSNILVVTANLKDWTKNSGGKERTATLIEALTSHHNVTLLSFSWANEPIDEVLSNGVHQIQPGIKLSIHNRRKKLINSIAKVNHDIVFELLKSELGDFSKLLKKLSKNSDLIILDHFSLSPLVPDDLDIPIIYNSHNCEISMANQLYPQESYAVEIVEKMEKEALKKSVAVTYCSTKDFEEMQEYYGKNIKGEYIPNGCSIQEKTNYKARMSSIDILFVGSGHPPNVIAANVVVDIAKVLPQFNFLIVGGAGYGIKQKNIPDNVKILGQVSDEMLDKLFKQSFAFINPMEKGSGTHLKMMKALSYGIPIISSSMGARGFSKKNINESILLADSIEEAKLQILKLQNEKYYRSYSENAYENSREYDWKKIKEGYEKFIVKFIQEKKEIEKEKETINKEKILISSILRNDVRFIDNYYLRIKDLVKKFPEYDFYLSIYENDSSDGTKQKLLGKDFSAFSGFSIVSENINTPFFGSTKDEERVKNLSLARNKSLLGGDFLNIVDYVLVIDIDIDFKTETFEKIIQFKNIEKDFDVVSATSIRRGELYDQWATRMGPEYSSDIKEYYEKNKKDKYAKYYSVSSGFCLYKAKPFKDGVRFGYINLVTNKPDCEMVVICQELHKKGSHNIYMRHDAQVFHNHN